LIARQVVGTMFGFLSMYRSRFSASVEFSGS
jgi:hypothetical protein